MASLLQVDNLLAEGMLTTVSLTVEAQQIWMLHGPSGSGKSRFLKAVADLIPHKGKVSLNGKLQTDIEAQHWRRKVMYFSATSAWWADNIAEHFESPPSTEQLKALGLSKTILMRHPEDCSSGEKQRLALLRGLAYSPEILLLDEITANLDETNTLQVEQLLQDYLENVSENQTRAIIWVSHDQMQCQRLSRPELMLDFELAELNYAIS